MPDFSPPELATLVKAPPVGDEWVHEVKYDGYRALVHVKGGRSVVHTRRGQDWTDRFEEIAAAAAALPVEGAIFDGEIVALRADGISDFGALQAAMGAGGAGRRLVCFVFDLLHLDGRNLRELPLHERKSILESLFAAAPENGVLRLSQHITGRGEEILRNACKMGLEGIVSKLQSSTYEAGRGKSWLKSKCQVRQELVVGGYSEPTGGRRGIGALLVGYHDAKNGLVYAGKVGTGFTAQTLQDLKARLGPLEVSKSPFRSTPREKGVHWVKPTTVVEVELTEWTKDGKLRHPSFKGVREDKRAKDVTRELPKPAPETASKPSTVSPPRRASSRAKGSLDVAGVAISNAAKLLYPADGVSKGDVARYYEAVASHMLPHLARRPLTLVRCPSGSGKSCFFQKHLGAHPPASLHPIAINRGEEPYFYVDSAEGLVSLAQMGALEAHVWGSHIDTLEKPDLLVMDLDPDEGLPWPAVAQAARDLRDVFQHLGLHPFVKTTGGKGLHVVVPCKPSINWDETKSFTKSIADMLVRAAPDRYTANMAKAKRKGKIFVDYLRNGRSATAIAPYSTRAREHATVAMPISWDELSRVKPESFTTKTVPALLARRDDPWAGFFEAGRAITPRTIGALLKL